MARTTAILLLASLPAAGQSLRIAAASDLQAALPSIAAGFERATGQMVGLIFGSSGNFFAQIQNGAPFDLFLSADVDYPRQLEASGHAERGSVFEYARGRLVLWTRADSGVDLRSGLAVLAGPGVRRVALANPAHAPYGRAAEAALRHAQLYERVRGKFVLGENISQAAQFAQSGNADVGILALSLALSPALRVLGPYVEIPESYYPPIRQAAVVLAGSHQKDLARRFIDYLRQPETARLLQSFGFTRP